MENQQHSVHDVPPKIDVENQLGFKGSVSEFVQEKVTSKDSYVKPNIVIPADCLTAVSMPKNWGQVERLKQQRLMLHQQLFSRKLTVKDDGDHSDMLEKNADIVSGKCSVKTLCGNNILRRGEHLPSLQKEKYLDSQHDIEYSPNAVSDDETDTSGSDDDMPRLQIAESSISVESENISNLDIVSNIDKHDGMDDGEVHNKSQKMDLGEHITCPTYMTKGDECEENECSSQNSRNSSDLCDISASKINEALHNAIVSVCDSKKRDESRIRQVLNSLKMMAEEKENEHLGYKITKPSTSVSKLPSTSSGISLVPNRNFSKIDDYSDSNVKVAWDRSNIAELNQTKFVGLPFNVDSLSKQYSDFPKSNKDVSLPHLKQRQTPDLDSVNSSGKNELNYRNIALQKFLANKRLGMKRSDTDGLNEIQGKEENGSTQKIHSLIKSNGVDSEQMEDSANEKTVLPQIDSNHTIPKQRKLSEQQKELCCLKHEIFNKRMKAKSADQYNLKEKLKVDEQKMITAKKNVIKADPKTNCQISSDSDGITDSEEEMYEIVKNGYILESKTRPVGSKSVDYQGGETEKQLAKTKTVYENEAKQLNSANDKSQNDKATKNSRKQTDSVLTEFRKSGKEMVTNLCSVPEKHAYLDKLHNRSKQKRTVSGQNSSKAKTEAGLISNEPRKKVSPLKVNENERKAVEQEIDSSPVNCCTNSNTLLAQNDATYASLQESLVPSALSSSSSMSEENAILKTVPAAQLLSNLAQATTIQQKNSFHNKQEMKGIQKQSPCTGHQNRTEKLILPSGFVKDESTNQMFHTYHFNGHTFAMIDNKLYQIHLKSTEGKTKTVIGSLIPTTPSVNTVNARPGMAAVFSTSTGTTISTPKLSSSNSTVTTAAKILQKPVTYRFPVNIIPPASKNQKPLNLLVIPTAAATQSTQVIRKPLMHAVSGNSFVRDQVQQTFGQKDTTTSTSFDDTTALGTNVQLPVTVTHTDRFQPRNFISIPLTVAALSVAQPVVCLAGNHRSMQISPNSHIDHTRTQCTKYESVSPRTAKSLLTNKTYVMIEKSPVQSAKVNVQSLRGIEYCGSVVLNSTSSQKVLSTDIQQNSHNTGRQMNALNPKSEIHNTEASASDIEASHGSDTSGKSLKIYVDNGSNCRIILGNPSDIQSGKKIEKPDKENLVQDNSGRGCSKFNLRTKSPAKICSSMDSFIYTAKRKRKGTPLKKVQQIESSLQTQLQKTNSSQSLSGTKECIEENKDYQKPPGESKEKTKTPQEKITEPVPFLDYPARIVSTSKSGCSKKLMEIVASPKNKVKGGQNVDTSLDEEKIAKMISFANLLEMTNEKGAVSKQPKRKRLFKKRRIDEKRVKENGKNESTDSEHETETEKSFDFEENDNQQDSEIAIVNLNQAEEKKIENRSSLAKDSETQSTPIVAPNKDIDQLKYRNMFDELEEIVSKPSSLSESCNESNDSYDSSDIESYEKFVAKRKAASEIMKPKNQLIESYYTSQGIKELKRRNLEPKCSFPVAGSYVTSESSPKITELQTVTSESIPKKMECKTDEIDTKKKTCSTEIASQNSEIGSTLPEITEDSNRMKVKCSEKSDMMPQNKPEVTPNTSLTDVHQKPFTVGGKQVKRLIKTKFIILKGDICDRWFDIKRKTGFGEMSDPKFIHYLLRLEEERQTKMNQINEAQAQKDTNNHGNGPLQSNDTEHSRQVNASSSMDIFSMDSSSRNGALDMNNNNNAHRLSDGKVAVSDNEDFEATIVNVTDTPPNSPMLSETCTPDIHCQTCSQNGQFSETTTSVTSSQEKLGDERREIPSGMVVKASDKASVMHDCSRKRLAEELDVIEAPVCKKKFTFLSGTTQRQMQWAVSLFREWLKEKGEEDTQFEYRDSAWLDSKLAMFYTDALSHEGTPYSTNILQTFRRSLSLYLASNTNSHNVHISISQDPEYTSSNEVLTELILFETRQNIVPVVENVTYPITEDDMKKLYSTRTLSDDDPSCLIWKVWFDITFHLCKGKLPRNFWRSLTKRSLMLESDVNGVFYTFADYVYIPPHEEPGRMYATPNEPEQCPVRSTSYYLSKLCANCDALFQCSKRSWHKLQERWYLPVPVSREKLDRIMPKISEHAQLSRVYDASSVILTAKLHGIKKE